MLRTTTECSMTTPLGGSSIDVNESTVYSSHTDDTACVISPDARIIILSQFVSRVDR